MAEDALGVGGTARGCARMLFNSYVFILVFLPITVLGFYSARCYAGETGGLIWATVCSVAFYAYWNVNYVPLLLGSVILNYGFGSVILARGAFAKPALYSGVVLNIVALGYFKYANFLVSQIEMSTGNIGWTAVIMPLAISFYTFQQIAYLVDCHHGKINENSLIRYVFVVTFFPHLIAGPIVRFREIAPQFRVILSKPMFTNVAIGLAVFIVGLAKKVIVADYFSGVASPLFASAHTLDNIDPLNAWIAALSYSMQLYFDFSGYSDMAIGLARMFGFRLAVNFLSPYKSASIAEFWRRWHITLSRFLRDYIYIPLGGNRRGSFRAYVNLLLTMAIGGLWHGAAWTFVAWGFYHGVLLGLNRLWRQTRISLWHPVAVMVTFLSIVGGWVLFRSADFHTARTILLAMADVGTIQIPSEGRLRIVLTICAMVFCWISPNVYQVFHSYRPALLLLGQYQMARPKVVALQWRFTLPATAALSGGFVYCLWQMRMNISEFIYFMF